METVLTLAVIAIAFIAGSSGGVGLALLLRRN